MIQQFDSHEEQYMDWWLQELKALGYIKEIIHQPTAYPLSSQVNVDYFEPYKKKEGGKLVSEEILPPHVYTPDVKVIWDESAIGLFATPLHSEARKKKNRSFQTIICQDVEVTETGKGAEVKFHYYSIIEVKPSFDQNNMTRLAKINIKWVWEKHGDFVNIIIPEQHFHKTFTPQKFLFTNKSGQPRKIKYKNIVTLKEFLSKKCNQSSIFT
jgi:hypothetical protein